MLFHDLTLLVVESFREKIINTIFFATAVSKTSFSILLLQLQRQQRQKKDKYVLVLLSLKKCRFPPVFKIGNRRSEHVPLSAQSEFFFFTFQNW